MDKRLEAAFDLVNYQETLRNQRDLLEQWVNEKLQHAFNGGLFDVTPELISMINVLIANNRTDAVLLDKNKTPIKIEDLQIFSDDIIGQYIEVTNQYYAEYQKLQAQRTTAEVVGECNEGS
jgi:hypothetical protein